MIALDVSPVAWNVQSGIPNATMSLWVALHRRWRLDVPLVGVNTHYRRVEARRVGIPHRWRPMPGRPRLVSVATRYVWRGVGGESTVAIHTNNHMRLAARAHIFVAHDLIAFRHPEWFPQAASTQRSYRNAIAASDLIVCPTQFTAGDVVDLFPEAKDKVRVVPWAMIDDAARADAPLTSPVVRDLPQQFIYTVAVPQERKNLEVLLECLPTLREEWPELRLVVSAGGAHIDIDHEWLHVLPRLGRAEMNVVYGRASCTAYPSKYEGFGMPVLEAMQNGSPVVASNASCIPEVAGDAAILVSPDDVGAWAKTLHEVLRDKDLRQSLRERGRRQASRFSEARMADGYQDVISEALDRA